MFLFGCDSICGLSFTFISICDKKKQSHRARISAGEKIIPIIAQLQNSGELGFAFEWRSSLVS